MKTKHHTIELKELQDWVSSEEFLFASSSRERKRLTCTANGTLIVRVAGIIVWRGMQPFAAVETYNAITEKYLDEKFTP
jgi:hypothetical protein